MKIVRVNLRQKKKKKKGRKKQVRFQYPAGIAFLQPFLSVGFFPFYWPLYQNIIGMMEKEAKTHINMKTVLFLFVIKYFTLFLVNSDFLNNKHQRDLYCNSLILFASFLVFLLIAILFLTHEK